MNSCISIVAQWLDVWTLNLEILDFYPVLSCKTLGNFFTLHCSSLLYCMNKYMAIDSGGYFGMNCHCELSTRVKG